MYDWRNHSEAQRLIWALPLETLWELAQFPLYTQWYENGWGYLLYGLAHCTGGDLLILILSYELIALLTRNRQWFTGRLHVTGPLFTLAGMLYTIYTEFTQAGPAGVWEYTAQMPIVPWIGIGVAPVLQWLVLPPALLWLLRRREVRRLL
ncbi:MAG: hypothetical protein HZB57_05930 [Gammaproteobacteria bacterium]|nr:hypothetical protein [Gammaproteobacteria bacterium]